MLVLSILIMLALGAAVVSFFIAGAQWLLLVSAALVLLAFYLSRRVPSSMAATDPIAESLQPRPPWVHESPAVTIEDERPRLDRPRDTEPATEPTDAQDFDDHDHSDHDLDGINRPKMRPGPGHAIAS
jgi:hypothetical protein